jgi:SAM-dependent methyltransferase
VAYRYLLGDSRREATRLRAQARLWDPTSRALFDRLGIRRGSRILEIGPGRGSLNLELRRRAGGPVDVVEPSAVFRARLARVWRGDGRGRGRVFETGLAEAPLPRDHYDLVFARWVFLFLPDPLSHLRKVARALRPGGILALQEYHRDTLGLVPRAPEWSDFLAADLAFFRSQGGDASLGSRLPRLLEKAGLDPVEVHPTVMVGHPRSAVWNWLTAYFTSVMPRLANYPPFDARKARSLLRRWREAEAERSSLLIAPAVLDVVARRPSRRRRRAARGPGRPRRPRG